jgi:hypothetical protein
MTKYDIQKQMTAPFALWREPNVKAWKRKDGGGKKRRMGRRSQTTTPPSPHTTSKIRYHRDNSNDTNKGCLRSLVIATCAHPSAITFLAYWYACYISHLFLFRSFQFLNIYFIFKFDSWSFNYFKSMKSNFILPCRALI